jgi:hypothetical protein
MQNGRINELDEIMENLDLKESSDYSDSINNYSE